MKQLPVLILVTKKPVAGKVKTRLMPGASAESAANIAFEMICETVEKSARSWPGERRLLVSPDTKDPRLQDLAKRHNMLLGEQAGGDLGAKMESALCDALTDAPAAAIMGCDIPDISQTMLKLAFDRLTEGKNVLGPSADGGFYMIGLNRIEPGIFEHIEWSTDSVLRDVLQRMQACKIPVDVLLPCLKDIDEWRDFQHLASVNARYAGYR